MNDLFPSVSYLSDESGSYWQRITEQSRNNRLVYGKSTKNMQNKNL